MEKLFDRAEERFVLIGKLESMIQARDHEIAELKHALVLNSQFPLTEEGIRRETARECAEIASQVSKSYDQEFCRHAVGAETVAVTIRQKFGLKP